MRRAVHGRRAPVRDPTPWASRRPSQEPDAHACGYGRQDGVRSGPVHGALLPTAIHGATCRTRRDRVRLAGHVIRTQGEQVPCSTSSRPIRRASPPVVTVRGTAIRATDTREQYRQKIARITLDAMVQFVGLLDAQGTVLEINQVALDAVGITLAEVEGTPFWTTFWWQVSEEINVTLRQAIARAARGEFVRWDTPIYGRAGGKETIIIDASLCPVTDAAARSCISVPRGATSPRRRPMSSSIARQREALAQLDVLKTQFFANISHEFRTPLTLLLGPLDDTLADDDLPPAARARLTVAQRNSQRLLKLVNTLLDVARIEAGRMQATYAPTDLAALTRDLASAFRSLIERAGLRFPRRLRRPPRARVRRPSAMGEGGLQSPLQCLQVHVPG